MFLAVAPSASFVETAITTGRLLRRCALAASVTVVSVMPFAIFPRVFPVVGAIISKSSSFLGPIGSASGRVLIISFPVISVISSAKSLAEPNRVSVVNAVSDIMGTTLNPSLLSLAIIGITFLNVQNEPHIANPKFSTFFPPYRSG